MSINLNTVSYDQYTDIPSLGSQSKIIFSENVYSTINKLINNTKVDKKENGCYIIGRKVISANSKLCFYFDSCTSKFDTCDGNYENSGVLPSKKSKLDLISELERYHSADIEPLLMHFHTHTKNGFYSSLSDQDYGVYATILSQLKLETFGMLAAPNKTLNDTTEISVVCAIDSKIVNQRACASFYTIPNIYHIEKNNILKVGTFSKHFSGDITVQNEINKADRFVQNYREWRGTGLTSAQGINPITGLPIKDENVGYVDINRNLCFPKENLTLEIPRIQPINTSSFRR